ncbi:TadE/TadG family type IV pilus assembly protein [Roseibaca sp. Y0-43]|uniref:TadE/TadG family type IV pilus assembly protein n=1 Tax=Roseibaca sp. Y0-43 TaxID=2816854 RepID=UPI001D0C7C0F|nr:TadE/TadG family type IV pilus assembly protein [Roseibaca sp. Y0-43]MCC1482896.1 pilus assembly protein [Roseibaca sp. Y0-43]
MVVSVFRRFICHEAGVSAVELALIAPFVLTALLFMMDLGVAIHQRMAINYILRLGGEAAMRGAGPEQLVETLDQAVLDHATARMDTLQIAPPRWICRCSGADDVIVPCSQNCASGRPPNSYVELSAEMPYRSLVMGDRLNITLRGNLQLQVIDGPL